MHEALPFSTERVDSLTCCGRVVSIHVVQEVCMPAATLAVDGHDV